jgi:DNA (cytosine-5)-methyltransferase 1
LRLIDLFSGIGGFSLAAEWCWGADLEIEAFVEIDPFCQKVLAKNFSGVPIYDDIKKIQWVVAESTGANDGRYFRESQAGQIPEPGNGSKPNPSSNPESEQIDSAKPGGLHPEPSMEVRTSRIDLLTGGFPCQPFSCAGKRGGAEDDRHLWPEMLRTIHEVKPRWVVAENVPGLLTLQDGLVFEGVCAGLEAEGYEVQPVIIPACAQGAPHRRDRVWIVAKSTSGGCGSRGTECEGQLGAPSLDQSDCHAPDTERNTERAGLCQEDPGGKWRGRPGNETWQEHWYEVATRLCRVDDGLPRGMDRVNRLKALGNSIVPSVAYQIFMAIKNTDKENKTLDTYPFPGRKTQWHPLSA